MRKHGGSAAELRELIPNGFHRNTLPKGYDILGVAILKCPSRVTSARSHQRSGWAAVPCELIPSGFHRITLAKGGDSLARGLFARPFGPLKGSINLNRGRELHWDILRSPRGCQDLLPRCQSAEIGYAADQQVDVPCMDCC